MAEKNSNTDIGTDSTASVPPVPPPTPLPGVDSSSPTSSATVTATARLQATLSTSVGSTSISYPSPQSLKQIHHVPSVLFDDEIQREGSVNPSALRVTENLYQYKFPSSGASSSSSAVTSDDEAEALQIEAQALAATILADQVENRCGERSGHRRQHHERHHRHNHPKVLILFCGGTLIMKEGVDGSLVVNDRDAAIEMLLGLEPRLEDEIAYLAVEHIDNIDSSNVTPKIYDQIGSVINEKYDKYDGFVITHGTDTMAYTSSALSFVLGDIGKPVVITGAQIPGTRIETDARRNFVNAVRVATLDRAGVFLVFDGDIILGSRAHKLSESKLDAFGPINWGLLGEIRIDIRFSDDAKPRHHRPLNYQPGFDTNIVVYTMFPGFPPKEIMEVIDRGTVRGIVLISYGSGNLSYVYMDAIKKATSKGIACVVTTQCLEGATLMHLYDVGRQGLKNGAIQAYDMSKECIITKLMWALHRTSSIKEVQQILHTNYTGEINVEGKLYGART